MDRGLELKLVIRCYVTSPGWLVAVFDWSFKAGTAAVPLSNWLRPLQLHQLSKGLFINVKLNCQALVPSPKFSHHRSRPKPKAVPNQNPSPFGTGGDTKNTPHPPITFNHEGVFWEQSA